LSLNLSSRYLEESSLQVSNKTNIEIIMQCTSIEEARRQGFSKDLYYFSKRMRDYKE